MSRTDSTGEGRYVKTSISLPAETLAHARERAGERGLSAYVAEMLEREERRFALRKYLAEAEAEFGPIPEDVLEEVRQVWPAARAVL